MPLLHRRPKPLEPDERTFRDDRLIVVVTEDTYAPKQYFRLIHAPRVVVKVAASQGGYCSPTAILESGRALRADKDFCFFDEFWLLLDTDHWTQPAHVGNFMTVAKSAREEGFNIAVSDPCFDLWLLLHHEEIASTLPIAPCSAVGARIRHLIGEFNKTNLKAEHYDVARALVAIERAKGLTPYLAAFRLNNPGTQVWALVERALRELLLKVGA